MGDEYYAIQRSVLSAWPPLQTGQLSDDPEMARRRLVFWIRQMTRAQIAVLEHALEDALLLRPERAVRR